MVNRSGQPYICGLICSMCTIVCSFFSGAHKMGVKRLKTYENKTVNDHSPQKIG